MTKFGVPFALLCWLMLFAITPGVSDSMAYALRFTRGIPVISAGEIVRPNSAVVVSTSGGASVTVTVCVCAPISNVTARVCV